MSFIFNDSGQYISMSKKERESWPGITNLQEEFSVDDLNSIHTYLSIAGSLRNISAISHQYALLRTIVPTNQARLHLCWIGRVIYIKPLPNYLLDFTYVNEHVWPPNTWTEIDKATLGFMRSYCMLILTPLDLTQAKRLGLIDERVKWLNWHRWRAAVLRAVGEDSDERVNIRYQYGELRISRLNWIWRFKLRGVCYFAHHREYTTYFGEYFQMFIIVFAFATTVLQGMQVALQVPNASDGAFPRMSYIFAIVAMCTIWNSEINRPNPSALFRAAADPGSAPRSPSTPRPKCKSEEGRFSDTWGTLPVGSPVVALYRSSGGSAGFHQVILVTDGTIRATEAEVIDWVAKFGYQYARNDDAMTAITKFPTLHRGDKEFVQSVAEVLLGDGKIPILHHRRQLDYAAMGGAAEAD
ncbi:hypothetical protein F5Y13DRAFT_190888 [Hypoxylon sp. FL1857]|nr:hypothetical protein F5Y13DRAFT_190888 [Hypoxylon sp. FL1857]